MNWVPCRHGLNNTDYKTDYKLFIVRYKKGLNHKCYPGFNGSTGGVNAAGCASWMTEIYLQPFLFECGFELLV